MSVRVEAGFPGHPRCYRGVCSYCGRTAPGERVLNTSMEADHQDGIYSNIYLCESCVTEWGSMFGQIRAPEAAALRGKNELLELENERLRTQLTHYEHLEALIQDGQAAKAARDAKVAALAAEDAAAAAEGYVKVVPKGRRS